MLLLTYIRLTATESSIHMKNLAYMLMAAQLLHSLYIYIYIYIYIIDRGNMEQILLACALPKETVAPIIMLYRNTKVKVRSPDGDTGYFDIVPGVLQGDTLAWHLFIICLDYVLRTSIDKIKETVSNYQKKEAEGTPEKKYRHRQHRWYIASDDCTGSRQNPAT